MTRKLQVQLDDVIKNQVIKALDASAESVRQNIAEHLLDFFTDSIPHSNLVERVQKKFPNAFSVLNGEDEEEKKSIVESKLDEFFEDYIYLVINLISQNLSLD